MIRNFLFPSSPKDSKTSALLLAARIAFGIIFLTHGYQKLTNYLGNPDFASSFPDPLGVGSQASLIMAIFGEFFCGLGFLFGCLYRLALIPMMFTMLMAIFIIHGNDPFAQKEMAVIYLLIFIFMYITGPGKFAIDRLFIKKRF